eukprot:TRINITY_DN45379_c0_g1_i1.p1 TRINITY_DN45379_c0_g1~~TRINITY_DN45379_c0_g1_i1.p1  ORF type:complete len:587 (+),score=92.24 TRINITY_DN45379_c0_g1_i1:133-1761(+)
MLLTYLPEWLAVVGFYAISFSVWIILERTAFIAEPAQSVLAWSQRLWLLFLAWYTFTSCREWSLKFKTRSKRSHVSSPSNRRRPSAGVRKREAIGLPTLIETHERLTCPFSQKQSSQASRCPLNKISEVSDKRPAEKQKSVPTPEVPLPPAKAQQPSGRARRRGSAMPELPSHLGAAALDHTLAEHLDMDHVHLAFWDFMWARIFIGLPLYANMLFGGPNTLGVIRYAVARALQYCGIFRREKKDPRKICSDLLLNTSAAMYVQEIMEEVDGKKVAHFLVPDTPHYVNGGRSLVFKDLKATVDLQEKVLMRASYGDKDIQADEAMIALNIVALFMGHPLLHAYTNWAVNPESPDRDTRRCSIVTVLYNNYGKEGFGYLLDLLNGLGLSPVGSACYGSLISTISQHPPQHSHVRCLMQHSDFVAYVVKARNFFLNEFAKYQADFPGIDGEALFLTCVFHAIDHFNYCRLQSALDIVCSNSEYLTEMVMIRSALVATADKLWLAPFFYDLTCRGSRHPLFQRLYHFCKRLDCTLADEMECCVMR